MEPVPEVEGPHPEHYKIQIPNFKIQIIKNFQFHSSEFGILQ